MVAANDRRALLARLRAKIAPIERQGYADLAPCPLGDAAIDAALPGGGLARACVHEIAGPIGVRTAFAAFIAGRLRAADRARDAVVWIGQHWRRREDGMVYGPGLAAHGLDHRRLILLHVRTPLEVFQAAEEVLRCKGVAAALIEADGCDIYQSRRLQLAAENGRATGILLGQGAGPSAAVTRWRVDPDQDGTMHVALRRCRGGAPNAWRVRFDGTALRLRVSTLLADRTVAPSGERTGSA
ncbi:MAG: ImuA family protein [Geminicoccaceae bacterium]